LFTAILNLANGFRSILAAVILMGLAQGPLIALADTFTWTQIRASCSRQPHERYYTRIRLWGSVGFILGSLAAGVLLVRFSAASLIWLIVAAAGVIALAAFSVMGVRSAGLPGFTADARKFSNFWPLAGIIIGASAVQVSHAMYYAFSSLRWASDGMAGTTIGALWSVSVFSEVAFFAFAMRFSRFLGGPLAMLRLGAGAAAIRWSVMALDPPIGLLILLQIGQGITFGATHLGSMVAISRFAPRDVQARAQGWLAAAWAGLTAILTAAEGAIYPQIHERAYWIMVAVALSGLALFALAAKTVRTRDLN
jgi:PPP family 3-phenylpropionic acid transporter